MHFNCNDYYCNDFIKTNVEILVFHFIRLQEFWCQSKLNSSVVDEMKFDWFSYRFCYHSVRLFIHTILFEVLNNCLSNGIYATINIFQSYPEFFFFLHIYERYLRISTAKPFAWTYQFSMVSTDASESFDCETGLMMVDVHLRFGIALSHQAFTGY